MSILNTIKRSDLGKPKLEKRYRKFQQLIKEVQHRNLTEGTTQSINKKIQALNMVPGTDPKFSSRLRKVQSSIINILMKEEKIVPKNYYRNMWLGLGMAVFGVPMGVAFGAAMDNMAFLGTMIPVGMAIGIAIGTAMDGQAKKEGRQLEIDLG